MGKLVRDETAEKGNASLADIGKSLRVIAGNQITVPSQMTAKQIHTLISEGKAKEFLPVGTQIPVTYKDGDTETVIPFDIVHHYDGSDAGHPLVTLIDGSQVPGMALQAHRTIPFGIAFDAKQAFYSSDSALAAGTYHFTVDNTEKWGDSGAFATAGSKTSYQFTLTSACPAKGQLVFSGDAYSAKLTTMSVQSFAAFSDTAIESAAITEGAGGTDLGSLTYTAHDGFNQIPRTVYGSNDWAESALRQWLNSGEAAGQWQTQQTRWQRPHHLAKDKAGFLAGLDSDFLSGIGQALVKTESHPNSLRKGAVEETYDRFFPPAEREHYFSNYLSQTSAGYEAEGVPWDYWSQLAKAHGRTSAWPGWQAFRELVTYDAANPSTARYVCLRSAHRWVAGAGTVGSVNSGGGVNYAGAGSSGVCAAPACILI